MAGRSIRIDGLRRTVADLRRSIDFYCGALGFEQHPASGAGTTRLGLGEQHIDLIVANEATGVLAWASAPDPRFQHAAIVAGNMAAAWKRLEAFGTVAITQGGPQRLPANTGGVITFKCRDPDGHPLELIEFPAGVGDPRWHGARGNKATLGIDHFALVVSDVDESVRFFAEQFGLWVVGRGINHGIEQDRLDGLQGVVVDVVSLAPRHAPGVPHLELLHYHRPAPKRAIDAASGTAESDEITCLGERPARGEWPARQIRDPDGHRFFFDSR